MADVAVACGDALTDLLLSSHAAAKSKSTGVNNTTAVFLILFIRELSSFLSVHLPHNKIHG
jgi:hypothetical protein